MPVCGLLLSYVGDLIYVFLGVMILSMCGPAPFGENILIWLILLKLTLLLRVLRLCYPDAYPEATSDLLLLAKTPLFLFFLLFLSAVYLTWSEDCLAALIISF